MVPLDGLAEPHGPPPPTEANWIDHWASMVLPSLPIQIWNGGRLLLQAPSTSVGATLILPIGAIVGSPPLDFVGSAPPDFVGSAPPDFVGSAPPDFVGSAPPDFVGSAPIEGFGVGFGVGTTAVGLPPVEDVEPGPAPVPWVAVVP